MKTIRICLMIIAFIMMFVPVHAQEKPWDGPSVDFSHGRLVVSDNHRFLQFEDGTPFFYLGGTAWELFHRPTTREAERYLENRRSKGFTVIQAVMLAELDGLHTPNANGDLPFEDDNPLRPNEKYFSHIDSVIRIAGSKGLFIGLLPTWGDKVDKQWGLGPVIFDVQNAYKYGQWIGNRYKDFPNIIWINGGDRNCGGGNFQVWDALGMGIKSTDSDPPGDLPSLGRDQFIGLLSEFRVARFQHAAVGTQWPVHRELRHGACRLRQVARQTLHGW